MINVYQKLNLSELVVVRHSQANKHTHIQLPIPSFYLSYYFLSVTFSIDITCHNKEKCSACLTALWLHDIWSQLWWNVTVTCTHSLVRGNRYIFILDMETVCIYLVSALKYILHCLVTAIVIFLSYTFFFEQYGPVQ